ncbi:MAG: hypothetical protein QG615_945, partial [Nitrospirota bacterium]|nr:hypothetical protein [Nitrospirota bacterium]
MAQVKLCSRAPEGKVRRSTTQSRVSLTEA